MMWPISTVVLPQYICDICWHSSAMVPAAQLSTVLGVTVSCSLMQYASGDKQRMLQYADSHQTRADGEPYCRRRHPHDLSLL